MQEIVLRIVVGDKVICGPVSAGHPPYWSTGSGVSVEPTGLSAIGSFGLHLDTIPHGPTGPGVNDWPTGPSATG